MKTFNEKQERHFTYLHLKRDGHLFYLRRTADDASFRWLTKNFNQKNLNFVLPPAVWDSMPRGVEVIGEAWFPGQPASYVSTAIAKQIDGLRFEVFSIRNGLHFNAGLEDAHELCGKWGLDFIPYTRLTSPRPTVKQLQLGMEVLDIAVNAHVPGVCEGFVLKNYQYDINDTDHRKWKPFDTADLKVVDVVPGEGKFAGMVGALVVALFDGTVVCNVSGMTDEERRQMSIDSPIGKIVEVKYQYVASQGKLRHGQFVRIRDDKNTPDFSLKD